MSNMPNSTKAIIAIVSIIILGSGIFVLTKSRPVENPSVTVSSSSVVAQVSSNSKSVLSSSSQVVSSSLSSEAVKAVETLKVDQPKVEVPKVETPEPKPLPVVESPKTEVKKSTYNFNYELVQVGGLPLTSFDIGFLDENIGDVADYYYNSVKNLYPNKTIYINSFGVQKKSDTKFLIRFHVAFSITSPKIAPPEQFNNQVFSFTKTNQHDGNFELTNLQDFAYEYNPSSANYPKDYVENPNVVYTD